MTTLTGRHDNLIYLPFENVACVVFFYCISGVVGSMISVANDMEEGRGGNFLGVVGPQGEEGDGNPNPLPASLHGCCVY